VSLRNILRIDETFAISAPSRVSDSLCGIFSRINAQSYEEVLVFH
jgi:hypothetical protein